MFMGRPHRADVRRQDRTTRPSELSSTAAPANAFVASFFGDINRLQRHSSSVNLWKTPFGAVAAQGLPDGSPVEVLIRPEALRLAPPSQAAVDGEEDEASLARVMASHMLGRTSLVHLSPLDERSRQEGPHLHARIPGRFLPAEDEVLQVSLDRSQTFVFPLESIK